MNRTFAAIDDRDVLVFVGHTLEASSRSGVQRVVLELIAALAPKVRVQLVKWDYLDGQLRFCDQQEIDALLHASEVQLLAHPSAHRVAYRFLDLVSPDTWLIFAEIPYHAVRGNEVFARVISQCHSADLRVATVFYDLIPLVDADYAAGEADHAEYVVEATRSDVLLAISRASQQELIDFAQEELLLKGQDLQRFTESVKAVPLAEVSAATTLPTTSARSRSVQRVVLLGTVEPRKQQVRALRAWNDLLEREPELAGVRLDVIGHLHPLSAPELHAEISRNPCIHYHSYLPDEEVETVFLAADFSVFISRREGFGLPIVESLARGIPCLTADHGAMAELASSGGCLTVDVDDDDDITDGLFRLATDPELRAQLRREIAGRPSRTWDDYATQVLDHLPERRGVAVEGWLKEIVEGSGDLLAMTHTVWHPRVGRGAQVAKEGTHDARTVEVVGDATTWSERELRSMLSADLILIREPSQRTALHEALLKSQCDGLAPHVVVMADPDWLAEAADHITSTSARDARRAATAHEERVLGRSAVAAVHLLPSRTPRLALVISTFNRGQFVERNVQWLVAQTQQLEGQVQIVVVDNASTDDTSARLHPYILNGAISYVRNPANTGMLGNLRVCSTLDVAKHVWLTGDDDFITRGALERVLEELATSPRTPMIVHNFGVYHRTELADGDTPNTLAAEMIRLAPEPRPTGWARVSEVAAQHDNLFTAVYPLVMRSDLLAAMFNYQFDGVPFGDLVESVPTTKYILEVLGATEVFWFAEEGIVGNAHNSWSRHRPRWHLVLMGEVLERAREVGLDPALVGRWGRVQAGLFGEGVEIAAATEAPVHLTGLDMSMGQWRYRFVTELPRSIRHAVIDGPPLWNAGRPRPTAFATKHAGQKEGSS